MLSILLFVFRKFARVFIYPKISERPQQQGMFYILNLEKKNALNVKGTKITATKI